MNNKVLKSVVMLTCIIITMFLLTTVSNAALSISTSKSTVAPGESFSVTVSVSSNEAGAVTLSATNGTLSQTSIDLMSQASVTVNCVAGSSGTISISASGTVANYTTETEGNQSASKSVTIKQPEPVKPPEPTTPTTPSTNTGTTTSKPSTSTTTSKPTNTTTSKPSTQTTTTQVKKSDNSKLSSLQIAEGAITPEFSSSVKEYTITVPNEITKLSISAIADSSKATVKITGNEEFQIGDNNVEIIVTAEDGSKTTYKVLAKRAQPELTLQTLNVYYIDENGKKVEIELEPKFSFDIYEYSIKEKIAHNIENLEIEHTANRDNARIETVGNEKLKTGKNEITVRVSVENEDGLEEQKTYKIIVEKEEEPIIVPETTIDKMKNWFSMAGTTVSGWISANLQKIITGMLMVATITFVGLTIYFIYDYKNYKKLLAKLAEFNKANLMERANIALEPENAIIAEMNSEKEKAALENAMSSEISEEIEMPKSKGKRFK